MVDPAKELIDDIETISSEELAGLMDKLVEEQLLEGRDNSDLMALSLDANALYPSLDIEKTSRIVAKRVVNSGLKFEVVNCTWTAKYVALNLNKTEIIRRGLYKIIQRKSATGG